MFTKRFVKTLVITLCLACTSSYAQTRQEAQLPSKDTVRVNGFWRSGWLAQFGIDMSLQNPYHHKFSNSFHEGRSSGISVSVGRKFTDDLSLRVRLNWENGITKSGGNWLAPFYQPGVNHDKGGYVTFGGDVQLNLLNIISPTWSNRHRWDLYAYPRAGIAYNFGVSKGTPLLGFGLGGFYRAGARWSVYGEFAYNMVSSGFTGHKSTNTGNGTGSNGFLDAGIGVQYDLTPVRADSQPAPETVALFSRPGWFVEGGVDMSLMTPYGCNIVHTFSKGRTMGLSVSAGKWFSREVSLRVRAKWENGFGLFKNSKLEWMAPVGKPNKNMDGGGYVYGVFDVMVDMKSFLNPRLSCQQWKPYVFARAGIISNLAIKSASPMVGGGLGTTYRIKGHWCAYADMAYQVCTSEFMGSSEMTTGMSVSTGCNGFADIHLGARYEF